MLALESRGPVSILRLRHGKANALDVELLRELESALALQSKNSSRALILTAEGPIFCAGLDLFRLADGGPDYVRALLPALHAALRAIFDFPKPLVAAINGHAIAGGCVLASAADARLMARGPARIGVSEILVGMPFPPAALGIMRHALSPAPLQEALLTGRSWPAADALAIGLIDELVEPAALFDRALERAEQFARAPSASFALTKRQLRGPILERIDADQARLGAEILAIWTSPETGEAFRKYVAQTLRDRK